MKSPIQFCLEGRSKWVGSLVFCCGHRKLLSQGDSNSSHLLFAGSQPQLPVRYYHLAFQSSIEVKRWSAGQVQKP